MRSTSFLPFLLAGLLLAVSAGAQARETVLVGIAVFNMAWAGTLDDFKRHVEVCSAPEVNWCASRAKAMSGTPLSGRQPETRRWRRGPPGDPLLGKGPT